MITEWITAMWLRMRALLKRRQLDRDLDDELQFHLAMREQMLQEQGMPADEAYYAARREFGNTTGAKENLHERTSTSRTVGGSRSSTAGCVHPRTHFYRHSMARTLFSLVMLAIASGMALLLGAIGLYAVIRVRR